MIGQPVTVYGEDRAPRRQWLDYFTSVLNSLGFKATEKVVNSGVYFTTIGAPTLKPQVGWGDWCRTSRTRGTSCSCSRATRAPR